MKKIILAVTGLIIVFQLGLSLVAERYAFRIGKMDDAARELNLAYLYLEEKVALFRSQSFLLEKYKTAYKPNPSEVIYIKPVDQTQAYSFNINKR